jgi:hypothetical protein
MMAAISLFTFVHQTILSLTLFFPSHSFPFQNMGAMRTKPLEEWGNGKCVQPINGQEGTYEVLNWDGTISPVVHQFDRHPDVQKYFYGKVGWTLLKEMREGSL